MHAIETAGLTKQYGYRGLLARLPFVGNSRVSALEPLNFSVRHGEIFGFLGPNGAGKSTTIRLLLGYLHPTAGRAQVLGLDMVRDSVAIRRQVGYLPGGISLYDSLTGEGILDYMARLSDRPPIKRGELCERLELSTRTLGRMVRDYSRGMRQKIGIVQALQHDPELAILDEPTEGLDPLMQRAFYEILAERKAEGRTVFFSSHVLSEVERVCDRVAIVRRGRLVAVDEVADLLARRMRHVEIRFVATVPHLEQVPGVSHIVVSGDRLTCRVAGDVRPLLAAIAGSTVIDVTIEPARLEDAFMELYSDTDPA